MNSFTTLCAAAALATTTLAQTQLVRADVDGIQGTQQFQLDCTQVRIVSTSVDLQALHDQSRQTDIEYAMQVRQVAANPPVLEVMSATAIPELFGMGNLRFGRTETWEVFGAPGSATAVFIALRSQAGYLPLGAPGAWLLGPNFALLQTGALNGVGRFQFGFQIPAIPGLEGTAISGQAIVIPPGGQPLITNPDCKVVRAD
jgi:hypothetical protein